MKKNGLKPAFEDVIFVCGYKSQGKIGLGKL